MSSSEPGKRHLRELLNDFFHLKKSAAEAHRLLVEAYGEAALSERSCREWFRKFKNGEFDVEKKVNSTSGKSPCCVLGAISLVSCIMSCSIRAKPLLGISTEHN